MAGRGRGDFGVRYTSVPSQPDDSNMDREQPFAPPGNRQVTARITGINVLTKHILSSFVLGNECSLIMTVLCSVQWSACHVHVYAHSSTVFLSTINSRNNFPLEIIISS